MRYMFHRSKQFAADLSQWQLHQRVMTNEMFDPESRIKRDLHRCALFCLGKRNIFHASIDDKRSSLRDWGHYLTPPILEVFFFIILLLIFLDFYFSESRGDSSE
jgi:hypothetical protein